MSETYHEQSNTAQRGAYGGGTVQGIVVSDDIGLTEDPSTSVEGLYFLSASEASNMGSLVPDGVLGLGPRPKQKPSEDDKKNFVHQLRK